MWAFHDTRNMHYRTPLGIVEKGGAAELTLDVHDMPGASVELRTWVDGVGEALYPMEAVSPIRHRIVFAPIEAGIVWYHFVITGSDGRKWRYGARDGCRGGAGQLLDWEPPSFQLTVCDPQAPETAEKQELQALERPYADMRAGWLRGYVPAEDLVEAVETLRENCDAVAFLKITEPLGCPLDPGLGILAHVTSLPAGASGSPGMLGEGARAFVDALASAGVRYWQILPLNPTDDHGSPYAGISAFAGNADLLDGEAGAGAGDGFLPDADLGDYQAFCAREADWLEPYARFMAIRDEIATGEDGTPAAWQEWPEDLRHHDSTVIDADPRLREAAERHRRAQFGFQRQWTALRAYANERGVRIIGDMPIYVSADSADAWANPDIFQLGPDCRPEVVSGCPPDGFAADGQVWGNPVYDWERLRAQGFGWWLRRLRRAFDLYDFVRLDHFIGFERYFAIPVGQKAVAGSYRPGPGFALFETAFGEFGPLPIIAEDLGLITPEVRALVAACGFPGMDVVQFVDHGDPLADYQPRPGTVSYAGTHDNHTLRGYCAERYPELDSGEAARILMERVASSGAPVRVFPLQDVLGLGDEARMNVPGTVGRNWSWRATSSDMEGLDARLADFVRLSR